jgi:adenine phosphoribosyltransferase
MAQHPDTAALRALVREIPDFPQPGVLFRDITPLLADPSALHEVVERLAEVFEDRGVDKVVGIEARGFVIAAPVAVRLGAGFVPVRKVASCRSRSRRRSTSSSTAPTGSRSTRTPSPPESGSSSSTT